MRQLEFLALIATAALCVAWLNPTRDRIAEGNRLFRQGKYDEATGKYGDVLVDDPDSSLLNFNMGTANYKAKKFTEAINSFTRVRPDDSNPQRIVNTAYNAGNAEYRLGAAAEATKPDDALKAYAAALVAYRRAIGLDPTDQDAKFNYEFVAKKIEDLKKKLEEQKKQQDQQQQQKQDQQQADQQQKDQEQKDQQPQDQQQQDQQQQQADQGEKKQQEAQQEKSDEQKKQEQEQQQAAQQPDEPQDKEQQQKEGGEQAAGASGEKKDSMSQKEAAALIDTARNDELQPEEFAHRMQGAAVAEPAQDW